MKLVRTMLIAAVLVGAVNAAEPVDPSELEAHRDYERQRAAAHARMPSTMYASTPSPAMPPHAVANTAVPIPKRWPWQAPVTFGEEEEETATDVFVEHISPLVQDKCVNCHVAGGVSANTRLVFVPDTDDDHLTHNQQQFEDFLVEVEDGANEILNNIRGVQHGGGIQVPLDSDDYAHMERFLSLLGGEISTVELDLDSVFDTVTLSSDRKTLYRAALVFAGRVPTDGEYASIDDVGLRAAIRGLMTGQGFHQFLIRGANDRLLTDRSIENVLSPDIRGPFVDYTNNWVNRCEVRRASALAEDAVWNSRVQYGARRAPLELIAHVVGNDLPYTEILTADYVMANPWSAPVYGADTRFDNPADVHEFKPARFASYHLYDGSRVRADTAECGSYLTHPGDLPLAYPHAGILNTPVFLQRYPTTATNRNRARSRWTYYHFLGLDIEKSASRTTDADALADTDNPTLKNAACTVCHVRLDPVAGAFQNYSDVGNYRASFGGADSLDGQYKNALTTGEDFLIEARSWEERETVSMLMPLVAGDHQSVALAAIPDRPGSSQVGLDQLTIRDEDGRAVSRQSIADLDEQDCGNASTDFYYVTQYCLLVVPIDIPTDGNYLIEVEAWDWQSNNRPETLRMDAGLFYRKGDTWYRDMRAPGFDVELAPDADDSVQWLAERIVADDRFAEAAVKFWWPAVMGAEIVLPPEDAEDVDFDGRLLAANAQANEVKRLAEVFREGAPDRNPYNLRDLLVEIVLSTWFRTDAVSDDDPVRAVALQDAGGNRLLTPEELAAKTLSLTGVQWGRSDRPLDQLRSLDAQRSLAAQPHALTREYAILYGGIDSDGVIERARDLTSVMLRVAQTHAAEMACPVVLREFYLLADGERRLFNGLDKSDTPETDGGAGAIRAKLAELHGKLFGETVEPQSSEVTRTYELFDAVWNRKRESAFGRFFDGSECRWSTDAQYFDGIPDDVLNTLDLSDPEHIARTWTVVVAAMLMDPRYLHL